MEEEIKSCSEVVFEILCNVVGNEDVICLNRLSIDLSLVRYTSNNVQFDREAVVKKVKDFLFVTGTITHQEWLRFMEDRQRTLDIYANFTQAIPSGSRVEGFNFQSSDYDVMVCLKIVNVVHKPIEVNSVSSIELQRVNNYTKPGFVRLKLPHGPGVLGDLFTWCDGAHFLSSAKLTKVLLEKAHGDNLPFMQHGPCLSTPDESMDEAIVLSSDTWPHEAVGCVHRLVKSGWPSTDIIAKMVEDGCLFVPIGCKTSPYEGIEWRMSFSLAEKRLVRSMNHVQFLTYGLLKLFLKETVEQNAEVKGLLCSYFMKTLVFWEITETKIPWIPSCLLKHFWNCFRRLLCWINKSYCPNFFIPENNMFIPKISGGNREKLLKFLGSLYRGGYVMICGISSLRQELDNWRSPLRQSIDYKTNRSLVIQRLFDSLDFAMEFPLPEIFQALESSSSSIVLEFGHFLRLSNLNKILYRKLCVHGRNVCGNKRKYLMELRLLRLVKFSSPDSVRSNLFLGLYFFGCKRYEKCISVLHEVLRKLSDKELIYTWAFDSDRYSSMGGNLLSIIDGMREYTASNIPLDSETCIQELSDECRSVNFNTHFRLIPPIVLTHFLLFLCNFWKTDLSLAKMYLGELQHFLECEDSPHLTNFTRAVSWGILGVGQEMIGDSNLALNSFTKSYFSILTVDMYLYDESFVKLTQQRLERISKFYSGGI